MAFCFRQVNQGAATEPWVALAINEVGAPSPVLERQGGVPGAQHAGTLRKVRGNRRWLPQHRQPIRKETQENLPTRRDPDGPQPRGRASPSGARGVASPACRPSSWGSGSQHCDIVPRLYSHDEHQNWPPLPILNKPTRRFSPAEAPSRTCNAVTIYCRSAPSPSARSTANAVPVWRPRRMKNTRRSTRPGTLIGDSRSQPYAEGLISTRLCDDPALSWTLLRRSSHKEATSLRGRRLGEGPKGVHDRKVEERSGDARRDRHGEQRDDRTGANGRRRVDQRPHARTDRSRRQGDGRTAADGGGRAGQTLPRRTRALNRVERRAAVIAGRLKDVHTGGGGAVDVIVNRVDGPRPNGVLSGTAAQSSRRSCTSCGLTARSKGPAHHPRAINETQMWDSPWG